MATITWQTGLETGTPATIFDTVVGTPTIQSTYKNSGTNALEVINQAADSYCRKDVSATAVFVARLYIRVSPIYTSDGVGYIRPLGTSANCIIGIRSSGDGGYFYFYQATPGVVNSDVVAVAGTWYRLDLRINNTTGKFDWSINGVAQTQISIGDVGDTYGFDMGVLSTVATTAQYDDIAFSATSGDYPLGPGSLSVTPEPAEITGTFNQPTPTVAIVGPAVGAYVSPTIIMGW